jgi:hypothetical protein
MIAGASWAQFIVVAAGLVFSPALLAEERICRGKWEGTAIEIRLSVNERTGAVSGLVYKPGEPDYVYASLKGTRRADGWLEVHLTYRFEDFGTFLLKPDSLESARRWQTKGKDLWFEQSG